MTSGYRRRCFRSGCELADRQSDRLRLWNWPGGWQLEVSGSRIGCCKIRRGRRCRRSLVWAGWWHWRRLHISRCRPESALRPAPRRRCGSGPPTADLPDARLGRPVWLLRASSPVRTDRPGVPGWVAVVLRHHPNRLSLSRPWICGNGSRLRSAYTYHTRLFSPPQFTIMPL